MAIGGRRRECPGLSQPTPVSTERHLPARPGFMGLYYARSHTPVGVSITPSNVRFKILSEGCFNLT
jgi:hypothetical protein